jgi:hypothetical protein
LDVFLERGLKDLRIVGIEVGPQNGAPPLNLVKYAMRGSKIKNLLKWVDSNIKEEREERIALPEALTVRKWWDGHPVKKSPRD